VSTIDSDVVAELAVEVLALRKELNELRQQITTEVRTRRVAVVDENDHEGVTVEVHGSCASVTVRSADPAVSAPGSMKP
jgi:hypothetical protein